MDGGRVHDVHCLGVGGFPGICQQCLDCAAKRPGLLEAGHGDVAQPSESEPVLEVAGIVESVDGVTGSVADGVHKVERQRSSNELVCRRCSDFHRNNYNPCHRIVAGCCNLFDVPPELWSFVTVAAIVVVVPGADMALVARNTAVGGRGAGFRTATGIILGSAVHAAAAVVGLSAVIAASATAFNVVKLLGAAYLVWLGVQTVWATRRRPTRLADNDPARTIPLLRGTPLVQGFLTNVLNPKVAVFFLSFLPQFIDPAGPAVSQTLILSAVFIVMGVAWLGSYVAVIDLLSGVLSRPSVKRWLDRVVGTVLAGLGLRLAATSAQ